MRQLIIGNDVAVAYTDGVLDAGAVDIQKEDPTGGNSTSLLPGDTYTDAKKIRFVQGTPEGKNIVSPWIDGKDLVAVKSEVAAAQTPQVTTLTFGGAFIADGEATVKLIGLNQGQAQFERKSYTISVSATTTGAAFAATLEALIAADLPEFIASSAPAPGVITLTGTVFSLSLDTELGNFKVASEGLLDNGVTLAISSTSPSLGYGDPEVLGQYEKSLQGDRSFYNRVELPNTPPSYVAPGTSYDLYSFVADNGALGQIKGVDNVRNITIGLDNAGAAVIAAFEAQIGPWLLTTPGAFII